MTVAIVGGGIAGLSLLLNLHQRGIAARVFEASHTMRELGVGITLLPHAVRELTQLNLGEKLPGLGIENAESLFFNRFGQRIYGEDRGLRAGYPYPEYGVHRGRLHMMLYQAAVERLGDDAVQLGHRCVGLKEDARGPSLKFETKTGPRTIASRAVMACDGVNSVVRKHFYPDEALNFEGINTWRGVTWRAPILGGRTYIRIGSIRTGKLVVYPIAEREDGMQLINWIAEVKSDTAAPNDWNRSVDAMAMPKVYRDWTFDWLDVPDMLTRAETIFEYPMVDRDPVARWSFGPVTLMGDAAHPMYPRGSNGAAQALIDARTLAEKMSAHPDLPTAFSAYDAERREVANAIVLANRSTPPDVINMVVEDLTGDRPFDNIDDVISREKLKELADAYRSVAGFGVSDVSARRA